MTLPARSAFYGSRERGLAALPRAQAFALCRRRVQLTRCGSLARGWLGLLVFSGLLGWQPLQAQPAATDRVDFHRDIRPILSDHCFACHGPDHNQREAELRLDTAEGLFGEAGEGGPVLRGDAAASLLIERVTAASEDERMPPPEFGKDLSPAQIELLRRWIDQGAEWKGHWAFQPIARPEVPVSQLPGGSGNPIDAFIVSRLRELDRQLSAVADRRTLARRLHFDLLGLPPDPEAVERFANSQDPRAYEVLVDELLASPHFGERMAMWWLDLVRYADSAGYHGDQPVEVAPFRDYVIAAFNNNKPFDQFTVEQLAGDLLSSPTLEQTIAAGYNRLGMMSAEGGVQPKEYLAKYIAERVRNLGGTWLGITLGCCECHDHKYDPFTAQDFYQFEAFFADIEERGLYGGADWGPKIQVVSDDQRQRLAEFDASIAELRQVLETPTPALAEAQQAWENSLTPWQPLIPSLMETAQGTTLTLQDDRSLLASGQSPDTEIYTLTFDAWPADMTAIRVEALPHESLPKQGPGRAGNGNFVLSEVELFWDQDAQATQIALQNASATYEQTGAAGGHPDKKWSAASAIDGDQHGAKWGWAVMEQVGQAHSAIFEIDPTAPLGAPLLSDTDTDTPPAPPGRLRVVLKQQLDNPQHTLGRFRILATRAQRPVTAAQLLPTDLQQVVETPVAERSEGQATRLATHYRSIAPELADTRQRLQELEKQRQAFDASIPTMLVTKTVQPRMIRLLPRGNWMDDSGPEVRPRIPVLLGGSTNPPERRLTRLDLAEWVVSPENPLTARVTVNRLWKLCFGTGLSSKLDDLGAQGEWPSHPALLDWLAAEFQQSGWNVKHMVKLLVMSDTYRQTSIPAPDMVELDPYNRLLAHQSRWRLEAEVVRDTALSISGLLVNRIGGQSVKPYQPAGYWAYLNFPQREWANGQGAELYRRGLYTHWQRQYLHPALLAFDAPSREECTADRARSNTPLQALVLLNDPSYVEAARAFGTRILRQTASSSAVDAADERSADQRRLAWAMSVALSRPPQAAEQAILLELLAKHRAEFAADPTRAEQLLDVGASPTPEDLDLVELAAWTSVARTLLNLHETITRN